MIATIRKFSGKANCLTHGDYEYLAYKRGNQVIGQICPSCRNDRLLLRTSIHQQYLDHIQNNDWSQRLIQSGIPDIFINSSFYNYSALIDESIQVVRILQGYAENFATVLAEEHASGLLLIGNPGTGKTHLGCSVVRRVLEMGYSARYMSIPSLLVSLREANRGQFGLSVSAQIRELSDVQLLVLDEYGAHVRNDIDYQFLFQIVDARYQRNLPTAMLTNVSPAALYSELDSRFLERLKGVSGPELIFNWSSWRSQPGHQACKMNDFKIEKNKQ